MSALKVSAVLGDVADIVARAPRVLGLLIAISSVPGLAGIVFWPDSDQRAATLISSVVNLYLQLYATSRALYLLDVMPSDYRPADKTEGRFPSAFAASFLSTVGIAVGGLFLLLPGLALLTLWSVWMPALLAERLGATGALRRSWRLVRPQFGPVLLLVLTMAGFYALAIVLSLTPLLIWGDAGTSVGDIIVELLLAVVVVVSPVVWSAAYRRLTLAQAEVDGEAA